MGRIKGVKNKQPRVSVSDEEQNQPKKTLEQLRDEHVDEKELQKAEQQVRYRKRKEKALVQQEQQTEKLAGSLSLLGGALAQIVCARLPNPLPPTTIEKELLGQALSEVAMAYVPMMAEYAPIVTLVAVTAGIVIPRLKRQEDDQLELPLELKKEPTNGLGTAGTESNTHNGQNGERKDAVGEDASQAVEP